MLPSLDSVLSFLKHVATGKVHPAACYKPKPRQSSAHSKRRARNPDAEEYLPDSYNQATPAKKKAKQMAWHHPISDAVALTISFRGTSIIMLPSLVYSRQNVGCQFVRLCCCLPQFTVAT